jgi:hypothetical protein
MAQYLAKPNSLNSFNSKVFSDLFEASDYLNEITGVEIKIPVDEWIVLNKIFEIDSNGNLVTPDKFPKIKLGQVVWVKFDQNNFV